MDLNKEVEEEEEDEVRRNKNTKFCFANSSEEIFFIN